MESGECRQVRVKLVWVCLGDAAIDVQERKPRMKEGHVHMHDKACLERCESTDGGVFRYMQ